MQPAAGIPCEPTAACTAAPVKARLVRMFLTAEEGPVASCCDRAASKATVAYCVDLDPIVRGFWSDHAEEIKRRCGPSTLSAVLVRGPLWALAPVYS